MDTGMIVSMGLCGYTAIWIYSVNCYALVTGIRLRVCPAQILFDECK